MSLKDKPYFAVVYMFIITAVFSSILIGFSRLTRHRVKANQELAKERAVLIAFPEIEVASNKEVHAIFTDKFVRKDELGVWLYYKNDKIAGYAVPFSGQGFWDEIKGIIGIAADKKTITGLSFYEQKETPGLGARIEEEQFRKQFIGKKIEDAVKPIGIVSPTKTLAENQVHAITGATQTSVRLELLMNNDLRQWLDVMQGKEQAP